MPAITVTDLNNAALDVTHIAEIATSPALTSTDRLGQTKNTLTGALAEFPDALANSTAAAVSAAASEASRVASEAARDVALLSRGIFETTAKALSQGVASTASLVGGSGGTNGTFDIGFSGGAGSGAAGRFVVAGGAVTSITITATGNSYTSAPTISFAASAGLTGASATAVIANNVDNGEYFCVLDADLLTLILYTSTAGAAVEVTRYYTKAYLDTVWNATFAIRSGYALAWLDAENNFAMGITPEGHLFLGRGGNASLKLEASDVDASYNRSGYTWPWLDSAGNVAGGLDADGNLISKEINITRRITPAGFWWFGDSLSASGVGPLLATLLGKAVAVGAVGGQTAEQVAARFGGQVPLFTVTADTIPASGAVAVTARTIDPITASGGGPITGKLAGIAGTYTSDGSTYWTFTRATAGTALVIDPATPFLIDILDDRMLGAVVFWYGRNNVGTGGFNADVKAAIADSIAQLKSQDKRFVVLSVLNWPGETTGTGNYTAIETLNTDLKALYPRNYLDVLNLLRRSGDGSADDIADAASGIIPRSLRVSSADGHLNNTTGNQVVANRVFQFLTEKGWTA